MSVEPLSVTPARREPQGVGGWLLLFVIGQVANVLMLAIALAQAWETIDTARSLSHVRYFQEFVVLEVLCQAVLVTGVIAGLVMIFRRHPRTPAYYQYLLAFVMVFGVIELAGTWLTFDALAEVAGDDIGDEAALDRFQAYASSARMIAWAGIWLLYWRRSVRVANTFAGTES